MHIDPSWRILTVGDGDLSFSKSLRNLHPSIDIEASIYDSEADLIEKYSLHELEELRQSGIPVHTSLDITDATLVSQIGKGFDAIIFQFPLIQPIGAALKPDTSVNTLNRRLLRYFLIHSFRYLLSEQGPQLCFITSKDVHPYREWNLEQSLNHGLEIPYLGSMSFDSAAFPGYRIRNVRRDTVVANTRATTYVWGNRPPEKLTTKLTRSAYLGDNYCAICRAGPFVAKEDREKHYLSASHQTRQLLETQWLAMIRQIE